MPRLHRLRNRGRRSTVTSICFEFVSLHLLSFTSSNKKLLVTSATLVVTGALLVVTRRLLVTSATLVVTSALLVVTRKLVETRSCGSSHLLGHLGPLFGTSRGHY